MTVRRQLAGARIGIDLGGSKIEGVRMTAGGDIAERLRLPTPKEDYGGILRVIADITRRLEGDGAPLPVGICTPGALSPASGMLKNSNSVCLNGKPFLQDIQAELRRQVWMANDANCLALSESADGAAAGAAVVFAVIIGTGVGGGIVADGRIIGGANAIGGEWGHTPLPWPMADELPGPPCYCGKNGCNETFLSGTGLENDYHRATGARASADQIERQAAAGDAASAAAIARYESRLARGLAAIVNILDPDVIVLGGGMSNMLRLYDTLPDLMRSWIFGGDFVTKIRRAQHGDSSGVRGAAWLP